MEGGRAPQSRELRTFYHAHCVFSSCLTMEGIEMGSSRLCLAVVLIFVLNVQVSSKNRQIPDSLKPLFYNNVYLRYAQGLGIYFGDVKNGYVGASAVGIRSGKTLEFEIGSFVRDFIQIGICYLYLDGVSESALGEMNPGEYGYDDVFYFGGAIRARYFLLNGEKIKVPIGIEGALGRCRLKSGNLYDVERERGPQRIGNMGDYQARAGGAGISGSFSFYPFWFWSFGLDVGLRIILSRGLRADGAGRELLDPKGGIQTLNLSGGYTKAYCSLQF